MLDLLRHPEEVVAATWDLSAGRKDEIHMRMCQHQRANFGCEDKLLLLGPFSANQLAVSETTDLGVFWELFSINNMLKITSLASSTKYAGLQNDPEGLCPFTCSMMCLWAHHTYSLLSCSMNTTPGGGSVLPADSHLQSATHSRQNQPYSPSSVVKCRPPSHSRCSWWPLRPSSQQVFCGIKVMRPQRGRLTSSPLAQAPGGAMLLQDSRNTSQQSTSEPLHPQVLTPLLFVQMCSAIWAQNAHLLMGRWL